jgi:DNA-binding NarL/FixJ family response regulator
MQAAPITLVVADDHAIVRAGIRALLDREPDMKVVAEASCGRTAAAAVSEHRPDVLLLDLTMPGLNGIEALVRVKALAGATGLPTRVLVLSMHTGAEHIRSALRGGADGYVVKGAGLDDLVSAIRTVAQGGSFFGPEAERLRESSPAGGSGKGELERLTPREREVLQLVAEGYTNREISSVLGCALKTVDAHRQSLMRKLDVHDAQAVTRLAVRCGLISPDD